jgi:hypothetical protein
MFVSEKNNSLRFLGSGGNSLSEVRMHHSCSSDSGSGGRETILHLLIINVRKDLGSSGRDFIDVPVQLSI